VRRMPYRVCETQQMSRRPGKGACTQRHGAHLGQPGQPQLAGGQEIGAAVTVQAAVAPRHGRPPGRPAAQVLQLRRAAPSSEL
jgi:hypothetical protein